MSNFPYRFEDSAKPKGKCPQCQQEKKFRYYQNLNGERLPIEFGKCDRENNCGYHNPPSFRDAISTNKIVKQATNNQTLILPDKIWQDKFNEWLQNSNSNFHQYCLENGISLEHLQQHGVGTDNEKNTVFIYRNEKQQIVNVKWVKYNTDGHREKSKPINHTMTQPKDGKSKYGMCFYGEDLLDPTKEKTVIIVESEKTKVIASYHYPMFDWLACGSNNGLTDDKIHILFGRKVIWLCDADKAGRNNSSIRRLKAYTIHHEVKDLFPERTDGYDIADAIEEGLKPEIISKPEISKAENTHKNSEEYVLSSQTAQFRNDNSIWIKTKNNWEIIADNFHIFIKYQTRDENVQTTWILEVKIAHREPIYMEISNEDFCSAKKLKTAFASKRLSFKANDNHVSELHSLLFKTSFGDATKITRFGFHKESKTYFFSNVALTYDGDLLKPDQFNIIQNNDCWLSMPTSSPRLQKHFQFTENNISFNQWFEVYHKAHTIDKAFIPVCFYIMSLFRDIVIAHKGSSPILFLKGSAGTGKSSIVRNLTCLFGFQQEDINLKSKNTESATVKLMSQSANSITWMDEYSNDYPHEGLLQAAYDNAGYHKSPDTNNRGNNETDSIEIHSALALTSNYIPTNPVFFSRCVLVQVENKEKTPEQRLAYEQLKEIESLGLAIVSVEILKYRNVIEEHYSSAFKKLLDKVKDAFENESIPERLFSNMVQTMTCAFILQCHGKIAICESTDEDDILDDFGKVAVEYIRKQHEIQDETSVLTEFFSIVQMLFESFQIHEGVHFRFEGDLLFLRMPSIYPIFKQRYRTVYYKESPDRDSIVQELIKLEAPRDIKEIKKTIRFRDENDLNQNSFKETVTNSLSIKYTIYENKFGLDLSNRISKN